MRSLSIVIPAYNEATRIYDSLVKIVEYLSLTKEFKWEIILVDDGSGDKTTEEARRVIHDDSLVLIKNDKNRGKGYSVKKGVLAAKGDLILFSDADLSTPIEELSKMLPWIDKGYDVIIGSRALPDSRLEVPQPWYRDRMGKIFNLLVRTFILSGFIDTQCGFKCFTREAGLKIFELQKLNRFSFDVETLLIANALGLKIKELPVRWINNPKSSVSLIVSPIVMLMELVKLRLSYGKVKVKHS